MELGFENLCGERKISAYQDQQRVGNVEFKAPEAGGRLAAGFDDMERIKAMMDIFVR
ncbi:hypothetical protein OH492_21420 [Vibrio chagasii]|nr:hypothetical protein [Vibrio chagasii]